MLSHRLRGFAGAESSLSGLRAALESNFPFLEVDTRHTADGEILVYHDALLETQTQAIGLVADYRLSSQGPIHFKASPNETVATLEAFLGVFSRSRTTQTLVLDLKDFGLIERYVEMIDRFGIGDRVIVISWTPEILKRVHELSPRLCLGFSYVSLVGKPVMSAAARLAAPLLASSLPWRAISTVGAIAGKPSFRQADRVRCFVNDYDRPWSALARTPDALGCFHVHIVDHVPVGELGDILRATRGYLGSHAMTTTRALTNEAHQQGLRVFVFSVDSRAELVRFDQRVAPDIVFTNRSELAQDLSR
ncbi:MAG: glycerophosphodiester phosphodiesterase family protein [bacterium]